MVPWLWSFTKIDMVPVLFSSICVQRGTGISLETENSTWFIQRTDTGMCQRWFIKGAAHKIPRKFGYSRFPTIKGQLRNGEEVPGGDRDTKGNR